MVFPINAKTDFRLISGITFYAFSQYLGQISQNIYFTVAVGGLIAAPGTILCVYIVAKCGRRWTITAANLLSAACFLTILAVKKGEYMYDWPRVLFAGIGIIGMSVRILSITPMKQKNNTTALIGIPAGFIPLHR